MVQPSADTGADPLGPGALVSIARVNQDLQVVEMLGTGRILEPLAVGVRPRLQVDRSSAFTPSPLQAIEPIEPGAVRVRTKFSQYELRVVLDGTSDPASFSTQDRDSGESERTTVVRLAGLAPAAGNGLREGSRVEVSRRRTASDDYESLGPGVLLNDPEPGQTLRIATDQGVLGTSPIFSVHRVGDGLRVETANADYRIGPASSR